jgi:stage V sporulation protein G
MTITEVRVKLCEQNSERLLAFCSVTFDNAFVVRDLKIIEGTKGVFVAMPSRKLMDRCPCGCKNHLRARYCNGCGKKLDDTRAMRDLDGRAKLHADIAHPIHASARELVQAAVVKTYFDEKDKAKLPGYVCRYDENDAGDYEDTPMSYSQMASDVAGKRTAVHPGHTPAPRGTHMGQGAQLNRDEFAEGIR